MKFKIEKSEQVWKQELSSEAYRVCREKGTEAPFSGEYVHCNEQGVYSCAACGAELFSSDSKFDSGSGWPSFDAALKGDKILTENDDSLAMTRTEILCADCGAHLGHVFDDEPTSTGKRYCVNSVALQLKTKDE